MFEDYKIGDDHFKFQFADPAEFPEIAVEIARIIAAWNLAEWTLGTLVELLTGTDDAQALFMLDSLLNSRAKIDVVASAGRYALHNDPPRLEHFEKALSALYKAVETRNFYAHTKFGKDQKGRVCALTITPEWLDLKVHPKTSAQRARVLITKKKLAEDLRTQFTALGYVNDMIVELFNSLPRDEQGRHYPPQGWLRRSREQHLQWPRRRLAKSDASKGSDTPPQS